MADPISVHISDIVMMPVSELKPHPKNPNSHSKDQIKRLAQILSYQGWRYPIKVSNLSGYITSGHGRLEAAKYLGLDEVPVSFQDYADTDQEFADIVADNAIASWSELDFSAINSELGSFSPDFDIDLLGIDGFKIDVAEKGLTDPDAVPENVETRVKPGDIWILGNHRLMCGDSTNALHVKRLFDGHKPLIMVTDPPYGIEYDATWREDAGVATKTRTGKVQNDNRSDWTEAWALCEASIVYVFHASKFTDIVKQSLEKCDFEIKQQIIWNKPNFTLGRQSYHWKHEPCWYAVRHGCTTSWLGSRDQSTVWDVASPIRKASKSHVAADDKVETIHPTQKPMRLYEIPIENHTTEEDFIYDPFGGSGTCLIACEKLCRQGLSMELDPRYCDVIIKRWEDFTGQQAVLSHESQPIEEGVEHV